MTTHESAPRVAIVGAGIAGLTAARELARAGVGVTVFDKGRGVSGRASTRYADGDRRFDHGAQYFTARSEEFAAEIEQWRDAGVAAEWTGRVAAVRCDDHDRHRDVDPSPKTRWVGTLGMNAPAKHLAQQVTEAGGEVHVGVRVAPLKRSADSWRLVAQAGDGREEVLGEYDRVLVTVPAPQAAELLTASPTLANAAKSVRTTGCWAAMVAFDTPVAAGEDGFDAAFVNAIGDAGGAGSGDADIEDDAVLSWIARNGSKPGRPDPSAAGDCWVLHGSPAWSERNLELTPDEALEAMLNAFGIAVAESLPKPAYASAHRWRFALPETPLADPVLADPRLGLFAAGDWCGGPRIEGAYLSGRAAARAVLADVEARVTR